MGTYSYNLIDLIQFQPGNDEQFKMESLSGKIFSKIIIYIAEVSRDCKRNQGLIVQCSIHIYNVNIVGSLRPELGL